MKRLPKMRHFYQLGDNPTREESKAHGVEHKLMTSWMPPAKDGRFLRAKRTYEFRAPRKGEWYLSGASVRAYRAPNDLTSEYDIAKLVVVERTTKITEVEI